MDSGQSMMDGRHRRQVRLFWVVLSAFMLVILVSICGMFAFFGLAVRQVEHSELFQIDAQQPWHTYTDLLADYYIARGNSWVGVDQHLHELSAFEGMPFRQAILVDATGRVVASQDRHQPIGLPLNEEMLQQGFPVQVEGTHVGTFLLVGPDNGWQKRSGPPPFIHAIAHDLLIAAVILALILLFLAALFARRLSRPLRVLTDAAQSVASGHLNVQVPGAQVKEMNDLAESFNRMARALADADRQRRQMTADVAHELRTPLAIIKGRLEGVQDGVYQADPDQIRRLLGEVALLERLIEDLRLLALAEAGQLPLYQECLDVQVLLEDSVTMFSDQAATQQIALAVEVGDDLPSVHADPQRMGQVLSNLVGNALRYTPAGGQITLRAYRAGQALNHPSLVVVEVADSGSGIDPADLPYVFDRFWRADRARVRHTGGTGLGLAIARQLVLAHGGTIQASSAPGAGTTMTIRLPVDDGRWTIDDGP